MFDDVGDIEAMLLEFWSIVDEDYGGLDSWTIHKHEPPTLP